MGVYLCVSVCESECVCVFVYMNMSMCMSVSLCVKYRSFFWGGDACRHPQEE